MAHASRRFTRWRLSPPGRIRLIAVAFSAVLAVVLWNLVAIQGVDQQQAAAKALEGRLVTVPLPAPALCRPLTPESLAALYAAHYAGSACVRVLPPVEEGMLAANALSGCDGMEIIVTGNGERLAAHARYDNLGKGASGAAVQCMNLLLGAPETEGLKLWRE